MSSAVTRRPSRRAGVAVAGALVAILALAGCGAQSEAAPSAAAGAAVEVPEGAVVIEHAHGSTVIPKKPERVVALSWMTPDVVAALGTNPVGIEEIWGANEDGYLPWFEDYADEHFGGELPAIIPSAEEGPNYEAIKALKPDLILSLYSGITDVEYKRLSEIAPTVPYIEGPWDPGTWESMTLTVGKALFEDEKAAALVTDTEKLVSDVKADHPEFDGKTFVWGVSLREGSTDLGVYLDYDPRVRITEAIGLSSTPAMDDFKKTVEGDAWYTGVSLERISDVPADLFVAWANSGDDVQYSLQDPVFTAWAPIAGGHYAFYSDAASAMAISSPTVLSLPAVLPTYAKQLSAALAGTGFDDSK